MSEEKLELEIAADGTIRAVYRDDLEKLLEGVHVQRVQRVSHVEWENYGHPNQGWTVRAAHDRELAARYQLVDGQFRVMPQRLGALAFFNTRQDALDWEVEHVWELLPPRT